MNPSSHARHPAFDPEVMTMATKSASQYAAQAAPQTVFVPVDTPPTPAPSPRPSKMLQTPIQVHQAISTFADCDPAAMSRREFASLAAFPPSVRRKYLLAILGDCTPSELLFVSTTIAPLLKRDFLRELPPEISLHILSFIDDPQTLARAAQVSKKWRSLLSDESLWRKMCRFHGFNVTRNVAPRRDDVIEDEEPLEEMEQFAILPMDPALQWLADRKRKARKKKKLAISTSTSSEEFSFHEKFSYLRHFRSCYGTMMNWRHSGRLLRTHRVPVVNHESGVVTSVALDKDWVVVGLANSKIHVFSAKTGVLSRTLVGHASGVWAVHLVSKGGYWDHTAERLSELDADDQRPISNWNQSQNDVDAIAHGLGATSMSESRVPSSSFTDPPLSSAGARNMERRMSSSSYSSSHSSFSSNGSFPESSEKPSDPCCASEGWGQSNALIVSGGCDKALRVWDVRSGYCVYVLPGHRATIRCVKVLHNRPIAVTGSRDSTLRVWDVQQGRMLRVLEGHQESVRCIDVFGNKVVSGSYDATCRLWDIDTGRCIHVLQGHFNHIYAVAYDGVRIASGGLDTTVRVWDAVSGLCVALLQGHTALVCQLQLSPTLLATGGSDGRVITFTLEDSSYKAVHRIAAHDSSVTALQFDARFLVTGGNDGLVRVYETRTGNFVREIGGPCDCVWKVVFRDATCAVMGKRAGKTVMEIWSFAAQENQGVGATSSAAAVTTMK